jgi:hypothetical protein
MLLDRVMQVLNVPREGESVSVIHSQVYMYCDQTAG